MLHGDIFRSNLNELSSIREIEYTTPVIEYVAGTSGSDEALADVNGDGVFDAMKSSINSLLEMN